MAERIKTGVTNEHIAEFHKWVSDTNSAYKSEIKGSYSDDLVKRMPELLAPLYRNAKTPPSEVFKENGMLHPTSGPDNWRSGKGFSMTNHQESSASSGYTSTTKNLQAAILSGGGPEDRYVYVIDPQPHGRDQNHFNIFSGNDSRLLEYGFEQEISVPGPIKTEDIRGAVKTVPGGDCPLQYDKLIKNPHYIPQSERRKLENETPDPTESDIKKYVSSRDDRENRIKQSALRIWTGLLNWAATL